VSIPSTPPGAYQKRTPPRDGQFSYSFS
jgi:hypothetical protein